MCSNDSEVGYGLDFTVSLGREKKWYRVFKLNSIIIYFVDDQVIFLEDVQFGTSMFIAINKPPLLKRYFPTTYSADFIQTAYNPISTGWSFCLLSLSQPGSIPLIIIIGQYWSCHPNALSFSDANTCLIKSILFSLTFRVLWRMAPISHPYMSLFFYFYHAHQCPHLGRN